MKRFSTPPDFSPRSPASAPGQSGTDKQALDTGESLWRESLFSSLERMQSVGLREHASDEDLFEILNDAEYQPVSRLIEKQKG